MSIRWVVRAYWLTLIQAESRVASSSHHRIEREVVEVVEIFWLYEIKRVTEFFF